MKTPGPLLLAVLIVLTLAPAIGRVDGGFVTIYVPPWDKHRDINEPTQKAIIVYDRGQEDLILQVKYEGPLKQFGRLIPVPGLPTVQNGSMKCFYELSQLTQQNFAPTPISAGTLSAGGGPAPQPPPPVQVIETKTVGAYDIAVLSTKDSGALKKWLDDNQFYIPADKADVIDSYVKRQWYFVAVKIDLGGFWGTRASTAKELASGELNPLQISFASDRCIFPLKISSINGKPSEVSVYVISPEPLLEKGMLEEQLPADYTNDLKQAKEAAGRQQRLLLMQRNQNRQNLGATSPDDSPLQPEFEKLFQEYSKELYPDPGELPPYIKVTSTDVPECAKIISPLTQGTWWLTKQTWTFRPEEMRDLVFEPALSVYTELLGSQYGYFGDAGLASFGSGAISTIIAAMQDTNPAVRVSASGIFYGEIGSDWRYGYWNSEVSLSDSRFVMQALSWLKDPEPAVRKAGVMVLTYNRNSQVSPQVIDLVGDKDPDVRRFTIGMLNSFRFDDNAQIYVPEFQKMLKDPDPGIRGAGLQMLQHFPVTIPRQDLLSFFNSSDYLVLDTAFAQLQKQGEKLSDKDSLLLLQNPNPVAHLLALDVLQANPGKKSVELALPLLYDSNEMVRLSANRTLCILTDQDFSADEPDEWIKWWDKNKAHFTATDPQ